MAFTPTDENSRRPFSPQYQKRGRALFQESLTQFPFGPSKKDRPDLRQGKVMLSALEPLGMPVATDVVPKQRVDDPV